MTGGGASGTSGFRQLRLPASWRAFALIVAGVLLFNLVNATSALLEFRGPDRPFAAWEPLVWEFSSAIALFVLLAAFPWLLLRWPQARLGWPRFLALHFVLTLPFSLAHVGMMVAQREAVYALAGAAYDFTRGGLWLQLFFEWRKDALTYALLLAVFAVEARLRGEAGRSSKLGEPSGEPLGDPARLVVKDGARTHVIDPQDLSFLEAAANYVELHGVGGVLLVRGSLASFEARLAGNGFARVHRSRLVNRRKIRAIARTPSGDYQITLIGGETLAGSRRYREAIEAILAAGVTAAPGR